MFTFVHTADLHMDAPLRSLALRDAELAERVGSATRGALGRIVDACLEHRADALMIAGDLFDGAVQSMKTAAFVTSQFERLHAAGVRVFMIRGNHDAESALTREVDLPPNVDVFTGHGGVTEIPGAGVAVHGVSFARPSAPDSLLPKLRAPVPGLFNVGLLHTSLAGAAGHDVYAPCSVRALVDHGFDYWALGHVHRRTVHAEAPHVVMPGMPQGRDIGEAGPKSATLVRVGDGRATLEEIPTSVVVFEHASCDLGALDDWRDARRAVLDALEAATGGHDAFVVARVRLTGATDLAWRIRRDRDRLHEELSEAGRASGRFAIETLDVALVPPPGDGTDGGARAELVEIMREVIATRSFGEHAAEIVGTLVEELPPEIRSAFGATAAEQAETARALLEDGIEDIAAHMAAPRQGAGG